MISVVVPVYNVEAYIRECLDSVIHQSYRDIEIIVVDDGSSDNSLSICQDLAREDNRITVIHQDNRGVVSARQTGIDAAHGDYVGFVDGDDWIDSDMYEYMIDHIGDADLISVGCFWEEDKGKIKRKVDEFTPGEYRGESLKCIYSSMIYDEECKLFEKFTPYMVNKLYSLDAFRRIYCKLDRKLDYAEDAVLNYMYILDCSAVVLSDYCFYHYRYREDSSIHFVDRFRISRIDRAYQSILDAFHNLPDDYRLNHQLQEWLRMKCYIAINEKMGFDRNIRYMMYLIDTSQYSDRKVVLYGAGRVGQDVNMQFRYFGQEIIAWADQDFLKMQNEGADIIDPKRIVEYEYDTVLIAIENREVAKNITHDLVEMGIPSESIEIAEVVKMY